MRFGLRARFILLISAVLLCVFAAAAYFLFRNVDISQVNDLNRESKAFAALATKPVGDSYTIYKDSGTLRVQQEIQKFTDLDSNISNVAIVGPDGTALFPESNKGKQVLTAAQVQSFEPIYTTNRSNFITQIIQPYSDDANQHPFSIVYTVSDKELMQNILRQEIDIFVFSVIGLIVSGFAVFELISRFFVSPVEKMSRGALAISGGNYEHQIKATRNDEIGDLARSVNQMAESLKGNIQKLQELDKLKNEFIMITSHNLRTPLTIITGNLDLLKSTKLDQPTLTMITAIESSAKSLGAFAEDMLTIASIEDGAAVLSLKPTPITEILKGLDEEFQLVAKEKNIVLSWHVDDLERQINASAIHLRGAIRNLLDNAIKFTEEGGHVGVTLDHLAGETVIAVSDTGIGIAPEEVPKLFTKFHRGTSTLEYNYTGTGIGLYSAKLIVAAHGGTIDVTSEQGKGSTFTIHLPD